MSSVSFHTILNCTFLLAFCFTTTAAHRSLRNSTSTRETDDLVCRVVATDTLYDVPISDESFDFKCVFPDDPIMYRLELPSPFVQDHPHLADGRTIISIPGGRAVWDIESQEPASIVYDNSTTISVISSTRRRLQAFQERVHGTKSVLVVRVTFDDGSLRLNRTVISARLFGIGSDAPVRHVTSQFAACSFGKLQIVPADGPGVVHGVVEMHIARHVNGIHRDYLENLVVAEAQAQFGNIQDVYDFIMFDVPKGSLRNGYSRSWLAFAVIGGKYTYYNDENIGYWSIAMHELGHNFGLHHSSESPHPYGDKTGLMGPSVQGVGGEWSGRCFNGHKNWLLGWYSDRTISLDMNLGSWGGLLVGFADYDLTSPGEYVVIEVGDLYIQYNRRSKFNFGTLELGDRVTIVRGPAPDVPSNLIAGISERVSLSPPVHVVEDFLGTGFDLVIEACEQVYLSRISATLPDYMRMSIHLDDGTQTSTCDEPFTRSTEPSESPTAFPSAHPSLEIPHEMDETSSVPSSAPSSVTTAPSGSPIEIDDPSSFPSSFPRSASIAPSGSPSALPSAVPSPVLFQEMNMSSSTPSSAPSSSCDDSPTDTFFINKQRGWRRSCLWLSSKARPALKQRLCDPETGNAYNICAETCGKCTDTCEDSEDSFFVNFRRNRKNCAWLARRPLWQFLLCHEGKAAYSLCPETCNRC